MASSSACQRAAGRPASTATTRRGPHHSRPLDRWPAAGERHVERDGCQHEREPRAQREPEHGAPPRTRAARSITFWPTAATRCERPEARNSSRVGRGARRRRRGPFRAAGRPRRRDAGAQDRLGPRPHAVDHSREPAAPDAGIGQRVGSQLGVHAACALPGVRRRQGLEPAARASTAPTRSVGQRTPRPARSTTRSPSRRTVATRTPNDRARGASRSRTRSRTACPMRGARRVGRRLQARLRDQCAGDDRARSASRAPAREPRTAPRARQAVPARARGDRAAGRRRAPRSPCGEGRARSSRRARGPARAARSQLDLASQRGEALGADARDLAEVVDRAKAAVLAAVLEDLARRGRANAVEGVELLGRRGVEADRRLRRAPGSPAPLPRRPPPHRRRRGGARRPAGRRPPLPPG